MISKKEVAEEVNEAIQIHEKIIQASGGVSGVRDEEVYTIPFQRFLLN